MTVAIAAVIIIILLIIILIRRRRRIMMMLIISIIITIIPKRAIGLGFRGLGFGDGSDGRLSRKVMKGVLGGRRFGRDSKTIRSEQGHSGYPKP